ncbi:glutathione S-transferase N-terminal domain-containing protein [Candidatus Spongiihabitans sp.]|uniref:glutathione S-transferase N-terminal domain-containing protein n=1 Tax=Candidatus Spongiihabitans sp. TaxID=3101308 RepID=UPI003C6EB6D5
MTLLSGPLDVFGHCCRIVLLEKDIDFGVEYIFASDDPSKIGEYNPYGETPTLIDRDVVLYDMWVIIEYLDERFPHPPLKPADPVTRAKTRLMVSRLTRDWLQPVCNLGETSTPKPSAALRKSLHDGLLALSPIFSSQPYFLGADYTLVDAYFAPLLWRLPSLGVALPKQAEPLIEYGERLFRRPAFHASRSDQEIELR